MLSMQSGQIFALWNTHLGLLEGEHGSKARAIPSEAALNIRR